MASYSLSHLSDQTLLRDLTALVQQDRSTTANLIAHLAEVDARRLYLPAGYPSMYLYCVNELGLSEDAARKRIHAARAGRRVPVVFDALAEGRVHLSAIVLLAPHLTKENAQDMLGAASGKTKLAIEQLIADRFPQLDVPAMLHPIVTAEATTPADSTPAPASAPADQRAPGRVGSPEPRSQMRPVSPERIALQLTMPRSTYDKFSYAKDLLGHAVPSGDLVQVLDRALDALISKLERRKFSASERPRRHSGRSSERARFIPADVKRDVWKRDGGRCTFVGGNGTRCPARDLLEFDHVHPVARGGKATLEGLRLRCRAHNQYAAECAFGAEFMEKKRREARERVTGVTAPKRKEATASDPDRDVVPWLRKLGFRMEEARRAAELCEESIPNDTLEERLRLACPRWRPLALELRWRSRRRGRKSARVEPRRFAGELRDLSLAPASATRRRAMVFLAANAPESKSAVYGIKHCW